MNAPFPPSSGSNPADDEPELRSLLDGEARRQPPVSPDLRAGVDRRVRRHRARLAAVLAPVVVVVLVGAALLAPRARPDATLDTASDGTAQTVDGTAPTTDPTVPATDTTVPAPDPTDPPSTDPATPAPDEGTDCGTVEIGPDRVDPETAPIDCFIGAFNSGGDARLIVLVSGPEGGQLTETVTTAPGRQVHVAVDGSLSVKLPDMAWAKTDGGLVEADPEDGGASTDCGTITVTEGDPAQDLSPSSDLTACLIKLVSSGEDGGFNMVVNDATGGSLTAHVQIADRTLTVTIAGELTPALPAELVIPSDLTSHLPHNGFGLDAFGLGGAGMSGLFPGAIHGS